MPKEMDRAGVERVNDGDKVSGELLPCVGSRRMEAACFVLSSAVDGYSAVASSTQRQQHGKEIFFTAHETGDHDHSAHGVCRTVRCHVDYRKVAAAGDE
ncbi:hypothetical protein ADZ36_26390 [Streptomyces fradiae]|uniref:Uncharacterized protein n=1 Tax=Streptomyces fradiae TaxID=1906 RepID=A0ACC4W4Q0_STRFR|nr:hypothetical protein ADZ36_26390 [Streptomyces fradiae]OFA37744.1 hypothetical protein BEN35_28745 [Streptomyces fradiae]